MHTGKKKTHPVACRVFDNGNLQLMEERMRQ
jgi:hypothetical protein